MSSRQEGAGGADDKNRFARAANGRGKNGDGNAPPAGKERGPLIPFRLQRPSGPVRGLPPGGPTPEQTCLGCSLGLLAIAICAAFWFWYFWRLEQQDLRRHEQQQRAAPRLRSLPLPATPRTYE